MEKTPVNISDAKIFYTVLHTDDVDNRLANF